RGSKWRWGLEPSLRRLSLGRLALFCLDGLLGFGVDPPGIEADAVFGRDLRAAVLVPISDPERRQVKVRDDVIAVLQDPIERAGMGDEAGAVGRTDQLLDQFVDDRALDAQEVAG